MHLADPGPLPSQSRRRFGAAVVVSTVASLGCSTIPPLSAGASYRMGWMVSDGEHWAGQDRTVNLGATAHLRGYPWTDRGGPARAVFVGLEESLLTEAGTPCCDQWRLDLVPGFGWPPRGPRRWVGFEVALPVGGGKIPVQGRTPTALGAGLRLAAPTKLPWLTDECGGFSVVAYRLMVVPEVGGMAYLPAMGERRVPQTELTTMLTARWEASVFP